MGPVHGFICADDRGLAAQIDISYFSKMAIKVSRFGFRDHVWKVFCEPLLQNVNGCFTYPYYSIFVLQA